MQDHPRLPAFSPSRLWRALAASIAITWIIVIVYADLELSQLMESSDFLSAFYVAGHLVTHNRAGELYPPPQATSFVNAPFDNAAHVLLPHLTPAHTAIYMYSPLVAFLFAPFSLIKPHIALLVWQAFSVVAIGICQFAAAALLAMNFFTLFWMSFLFFPVLQTLLNGQLGLVLGLVPLTAGFYLMRRGRLMGAGFAWSLLLLKPQFLPAAGFVALTLALAGRLACLSGMVAGATAMMAVTCAIVPLELVTDWFNCLRLSDTTYSSAQYVPPDHLVICLPSALLMLFPLAVREALKWPIYVICLLFGLYGLWRCRAALICQTSAARLVADGRTTAALMLVAILLLPLIQPHFLFYDLSVYLLAGALVFSEAFGDRARELRRIASVLWVCINAYMILFFFLGPRFAQPIILALALAEGFRRMTAIATGSCVSGRPPNEEPDA